MSGNLPVDEMKEVKLMATSEIDTGNKILGKLFFQFAILFDAQKNSAFMLRFNQPLQNKKKTAFI